MSERNAPNRKKSSHREIFSESCQSEPNLECNYTFPFRVNQTEFCLLPNISENCYYNPNLVRISQIQKRFLYVCSNQCVNGHITSWAYIQMDIFPWWKYWLNIYSFRYPWNILGNMSFFYDYSGYSLNIVSDCTQLLKFVERPERGICLPPANNGGESCWLVMGDQQ